MSEDKISEEERALFRAAMQGVRQLTQSKIREPSVSVRRKFQRTLPPKIELFATHAHQHSPEWVRAEDFLRFHRPGLQKKIIGKLCRGEFPVEAYLDLHGMRLTEAHRSLQLFLGEALQQGNRCVCIIHGKGKRSGTDYPLLKNKVNMWLREYACVLGFCTAKPSYGGGGAVLVLLDGL